MKFISKLSLMAALALSLVACDNVNKQDVGTITGGVLGGVLGNQVGGGSGRVAATIGGTLVGAYLGGAVGKSMDDVDRLKMNRALESSQTQRTTTWTNPDSNVRYDVTPTKTFYRTTTNSSTQPCREYTTTATIGGKKETVYGTACRMDDGAWKIIDANS